MTEEEFEAVLKLVDSTAELRHSTAGSSGVTADDERGTTIRLFVGRSTGHITKAARVQKLIELFGEYGIPKNELRWWAK